MRNLRSRQGKPSFVYRSFSALLMKSIYNRRFHQDDSSNQDALRSSHRRVTAINPIRESTPVNDERNVSSMLRNAFNFRSPASTTTSSSALIASPTKAIREIIPTPSAMLSVVKRQEEMVIQHGNDMLLTLRYFLSNSRNIWSLTALLELLYIFYAIIPWAIVIVRPAYRPLHKHDQHDHTGSPILDIILQIHLFY